MCHGCLCTWLYYTKASLVYVLETVVHLEGPWQCFLAASLEQDSSSHCSQPSASGSFLLIYHLVQMMCSGLNGLGQAQLICNPADLAVRLL